MKYNGLYILLTMAVAHFSVIGYIVYNALKEDKKNKGDKKKQPN